MSMRKLRTLRTVSPCCAEQVAMERITKNATLPSGRRGPVEHEIDRSTTEPTTTAPLS